MSATPAEQPEGGAVSRTAEKRWPMAAAVLATIVLQKIAPKEGRLLKWWVFPVLELLALGAVILRDPGRIDRELGHARRAMFILLVVMTIGTLGGLAWLMVDILDPNFEVGPTALLGRGAALWVTNVLVFSLWFWELDRGGAAERAAGSPIRPSFGFPEDAMPELVAGGTGSRPIPTTSICRSRTLRRSARPTRSRCAPGRR